jgi:heat shock protein HtpX
MDVLEWDELRGVLAHELAHVKNRDILTQTIVSTVVGAITMLSQFAIFIPFGNSDRGGNPLVALLVLILAPLAASMLHSAVSRTREYEADRGGAIISGNPRSLASALEKIEAAAQQVPMQVSERTAQSTSHMFPVNPFSGGRMMRLFSTHPPTEERIEKLNKMAETGKYE